MSKTKVRFFFLLTASVLSLIFAQGTFAKEVQVKHSATAYGTYADLEINLDQVASPFTVVCSQPPAIKEAYYQAGTKLPASCPQGQSVWGQVSVGKTTNHKVRVFDPQKPLQPNTQYYYVIQVNDGQNNKTVKIGAFRTKTRSAIVYITSIQVLEDSDSSGSGELSFSFFLDNKFMTKLPTNTNHYSWSSGQAPLNFDKFTLFPQPGLAKTTLYVTGFDDDTDALDKIGLDKCSVKSLWKQPNMGYGSNTCVEWTSEGKVLNLADTTAVGPNEGTNKKFVLFANPTNGSSLQFEVRGYVRILYV